MADATGGSQGFAQLVCLLGNFVDDEPSAEMLSSLEQVLAWLGGRYSIDTSTGATTSFLSRGSNRWPVGENVTVRTISGHRDVSQTACPGDRMYRRLEAEVPVAVARLRGASAVPTSAPSTATESTTTAVASISSTTLAPPALERGSSAAAGAPTSVAGTASSSSARPAAGDGGGPDRRLFGAGALVAGGLAAGAIAIRRRGGSKAEETPT
jgi:hypothetical protein